LGFFFFPHAIGCGMSTRTFESVSDVVKIVLF